MRVAKEEALFEKIAQYRRVRFGYTITMELLHVMGCIVVDGSVRKKSAFLSMHTFFSSSWERGGIIFQRVPLLFPLY